MTPSKSILDPSFTYVDANKTDLRKTFARVRREIDQEKAARLMPTTVVAMRKKGS